MQDLVIEFLKSANMIQIIATGIIVWFFYTRLNEKTETNKNELRQEIEKFRVELKQEIIEVKTELKQEIIEVRTELKQEIEKLSVKVEDIDRRLCRIEGSLATHGHCLFNQKQTDRKAE